MFIIIKENFALPLFTYDRLPWCDPPPPLSRPPSPDPSSLDPHLTSYLTPLSPDPSPEIAPCVPDELPVLHLHNG